MTRTSGTDIRHPRTHSTSLRLLALAAALAATACSAPRLRPIEAIAAEADAQKEETDEPARPDFVDDDEWIRLVSGEWLKGEIESLSREVLEFDSEELDGLKLDWDDVVEVITTRPFTVVRDDRAIAVGAVRIVNDTVTVRTADGVVRFPRARLMRMVYAIDGRANWSGRIRLSATRRTGNTDQSDQAISADATRRTPQSRTTLSFDHVFSEVDSSRTADNQTFRGGHDVYLSPRFYITPLGAELFRDPFQNIAFRATPYTGAGYAVIDDARQEWELIGGVGYRYTKFDSVEEGEDEERDTGTLLFGSTYDLELTSNVDLEAAYQINVSIEDTDDTNQDASLLLTFEFIWDLDFDVRFVWKRIGAPEPEEDGTRPEKDDFRVDVGLSWEF